MGKMMRKFDIAIDHTSISALYISLSECISLAYGVCTIKWFIVKRVHVEVITRKRAVEVRTQKAIRSPKPNMRVANEKLSGVRAQQRIQYISYTLTPRTASVFP